METAWLIEIRQPHAMWWTGLGWTTNAYDAVWFCRKRDAEEVITMLKLTSTARTSYEMFATDHGFMN